MDLSYVSWIDSYQVYPKKFLYNVYIFKSSRLPSTSLEKCLHSCKKCRIDPPSLTYMKAELASVEMHSS